MPQKTKKKSPWPRTIDVRAPKVSGTIESSIKQAKTIV